MPPRPAQRQLSSHSANRLSAVYIGPNPISYSPSPRSPPNNPDIPDLPEPPSPSTSSTGSGLPSPPATNSTGSGNGSTGDQNSIAIRGKDRPLSVSLNSSSSSSTGTSSAGGFKDATFHRKTESIGSTASASTSTVRHTDGQAHDQDHDKRDDDDNSHNDGLFVTHEEFEDVDGDDTARLDRRQPPNENVLALQRVRSLTERNRMVLDKLSSYPRTGSPLSMSSTSRSSVPSTANSISRLSHRDPHSLSGSETEREYEYEPQSNTSANAGSSIQHLRSHSHTHARTPPSPGPARTRHPSAPSSPLKALSISRSISTETSTGSSSSASQSTKHSHSHSHSVHSNGAISGAVSTSSNGSSPSKRRKRVSLAMTSHLTQFVDGRDTGGREREREWDRDRNNRDSGREEPIRAKTSMAFVSPSERERERVSLSLSRRTGSGSGSGSGSAGAKRRAALPVEFRSGARIPADIDQDPEPMTPFRTHTHAYNSNSNSNGSRRGKWASASEDMQFAAPAPALSVASSSSRSGVEGSEWRSGGGGSERRSVAGGSDYRSVGGSTSDWRSVGGGSEYRSAGGSEHRNGSGSGSIVRRRASPPPMGMREYRERRQSLRGGSAESALAGASRYGGSESVGGVGRSLVGEELRAAGLSPTKRRYVGRGGGSGSLDLDVDVGRRRDGDGDVFADDDVGRPRTGGGPKSRVGAGDVMSTPRAATSMADYRYLGKGHEEEFEEEQMERSRRLRQARSALPLGEGSLRREGSLSRARETSLVREREPSLVRERENPLARQRETSLTRERETSLARERDIDRDRDRARDLDRDMDRSISSMSRYEPVRYPPSGERYASPFGSRRYNPVVPPLSASTTTSTTAMVPHAHAHQEHTRLMLESLGMFEGHLARLGPMLSASGSGTNTPGGGPGCGSTASELLRTAQTVVGAAERLNAMMRYGTTHAMEQQVDAEVEGGEQRGDAVEVWREVGGEFREAQRVSDDLVRGLTGFMLGIGKVVREFAAGGGPGGGGGESQHLRSMSLDEEGLRRTRGSFSPDVVIGGGVGSGGGSIGGGSGSGRRSVESRRSWEPPRDDLSRRVMGRDNSTAPTPPQAFRDKDRFEGRYETSPSVPPSAAMRTSIGTRRLFTPREQRGQQLVAGPSTGGPNRMVASDSQETIYASYEPSPTPASRNQTALERSRTLPALGLPKPIPTLPSESLLRRNQSAADKSTPPDALRDRDRERRQASVTSIASVATLRGNTLHPNPRFPASLTTPSATTALTPHTVSTHTPDRGTLPVLPRTDPDQLPRSAVAFSRPSTVSVSALNGLQQQHLEHERRRTLSSGSAGAEPSTSVIPNRVQQSQVMSGSETERDTRRRTVGKVGRVSLDSMEGAGSGASRKAAVQAADRSAAVVGLGSGSKLPSTNGARRERRRTVTEIWPKD